MKVELFGGGGCSELKRPRNRRPPAGAGRGNAKKKSIRKNFERKKLYILPTQCINVFRIIHIINRFPYTEFNDWFF